MQRKSRSKGKPGRRAPKKRNPVRLGRFLTGLLVFCLVMLLLGGLVTFKVVSAYMADVPPFDPGVLVPAQTSFVFDRNGEEVTPLITGVIRVVVPLSEIPDHFIKATLAIEDDRFYEHWGFDLRGILRAVYHQIMKRSYGAQGGSTITQQLAKDAFLTPEKTMKRKVQELFLAIKMERTFTKDEILEFYLNRIPYGSNAYGVEAAAQVYFDKSASELTLAESALLAGIPNLPSRYSPFRNLEESIARQRLILARMRELGMISAEEEKAAREEELVFSTPPSNTYPYPHFIEYIIHDQLIPILAENPKYRGASQSELYNVIYNGGLKIYTTLDPKLQKVSEDTINDASKYPSTTQEEGKPPQPQAAVIVVDPKTGHIRAMVGGRDYSSDNVFNRAVKGKMQAGSVLKPIIAYAPAFDLGIAMPGTVLDDSPWFWEIPGSTPWYPNNYDRTFKGLVTARYALAHSLNIPAARLLERVTVEKGKEYAKKMGITTLDEDRGPSLVLGGLTEGLKVIDAAQAFSVLANQGVRTDLTAITRIEDDSGRIIYEHIPTAQSVLSAEAAFLTSSVLVDAVRYGTVSGLSIGRQVAAKTGTSDLNRDAWLAAFTPDVVAVFWIGRDSYRPNQDGGLRAWQVTPPFMNPILKAAHEGLPVREFSKPNSVSEPIAICNKSGKRAGSLCPPEHVVSDYFVHASIPLDFCDMHIELEVCTESGELATAFCPHHSREVRVFLDRPEYTPTDERWAGAVGRVPADASLMPPAEYCSVHSFGVDFPWPGNQGPGNPRDNGNNDNGEPDEPQPPRDVVLPPFDLTAAVDSEGNIVLRWLQGDPSTTGFLVYRRAPQENDYRLLTPDPVDTLSLVDHDVRRPGRYRYRVIAVNEKGIQSEAASASINVR